VNWIITRNNRPVKRDGIPCLSIGVFREELVKACEEGWRVISYFGIPGDKDKRNGNWMLIAIMAGDDRSELRVT
jgi:hypothetical protein